MFNLKKIRKKIITLIVIAATAIGTFIVYAAFIEPSAEIANSTQDWAQNILGADNTNNAFDYSSIAVDEDGSVIERLEALQQEGVEETNLSATCTADVNGSICEKLQVIIDAL